MWEQPASIWRGCFRRMGMRAPTRLLLLTRNSIAAGQAIGGFGPEAVIKPGSHSDYNALQTSFSQKSPSDRAELSKPATLFPNPLDDTSAVLGGLPANAGVILQTMPQDPLRSTGRQRTFHLRCDACFFAELDSGSAVDRVDFLQPLGALRYAGLAVPQYHFADERAAVHGLLRNSTDRGRRGRNGSSRIWFPCRISPPAAPIREDYFGRGADNSSFFYIPIDIAGGSGPNSGFFGTLGRDSFADPAFII